MTERNIHFDNSPFEIAAKKAEEPDPDPGVSEPSVEEVAEVIPVVVDRFQLIRIGLEHSRNKGNNVDGHLEAIKGLGHHWASIDKK
jgi:hypothetical protein